MPSATDPLQVLDISSGKVKSSKHYTSFLQLKSHITLGFSSSTAVTIALDICPIGILLEFQGCIVHCLITDSY